MRNPFTWIIAAAWAVAAIGGGALIAGVVQPATAQQINTLRYVPAGYQQITTISSSTALTVPTGAKYAVITAEAQAVRYRDDGTAPSATVGQPLAVGVQLVYSGTLSALRFFEQASGAKLNVSYYK